jgi:bifunctional non-homologous end joining protein LigD
MLATPGPLPPAATADRWAFEVKWDGVRALAWASGGELTLRSRAGRDVTRSYPELAALAHSLAPRRAVLDGEIVALDADGRPSFERLQTRMHVDARGSVRRLTAGAPVTYMIFDLLELDSEPLLAQPYAERRARLESLGLSGTAWHTPEIHRGDGAALLEATARQGLEGLVAKRLDSRYEPGRRSRAWIKVKNVRRQEFVVGGWAPGRGQRTAEIGSLLLGYHDDAGALRYAGRVGSGLGAADLSELTRRLTALDRHDSPFASGAATREARFVEPELVVEVRFSEWTSAGVLRHPIYLGLRDDVDAGAVVLEPPATPSPGRARAAAGTPRAAAGRRARAPGGRSPQDRAGAVFDEVQATASGLTVAIDGRELRLTNYDKVLFPRTGFTKGQLIEYYATIAPALLPHLRDRPVTFKRYPDGVGGPFFYEKNVPAHRPDWVHSHPVASGRRGETIEYCLVQDAPTLVWAANLAAIELHPSLARVPRLTHPTSLVFDLDPGPPAGLPECCEVALVLRGLFDGLGLDSVVKTSGAKGLQVYVPLDGTATFADTKRFARQVADLLAAQAPDLVVSRMTRSLRGGRVFVDWSQNDRHKTTVSVYSVRAEDGPTVSAPLTWREVSEAHRRGDGEFLRMDTQAVLERVARDGDGFAPLIGGGTPLPVL